MGTIIADLRFAWRQALARPLFTTLVIGVLALGIGATTAIFSLTDAVLFRPLPIVEPDRVVRIFQVDEAGAVAGNLRFPSYTDLRDNASSFSQIAAYTDWAPFNLSVPGQDPARVAGAVVTGDFFNLFGVQPLLGRYLLPSDDVERGGHPVTVLSEQVWRTQFNADPDIVGKSVHINTHPFTVVGVMPFAFGGPSAQPNVEAWVPMAMMEAATPSEQWSFLTDRRISWLDGVARLAPGVSLEQAQAEVAAIVANVVADEGLNIDNLRLGLLPAKEGAIDPYGNLGVNRNGWLLLDITFTLLLIAMTNTASLMLVRTEERAREIALRLGLGAPRARVLRMLLVEALVYAAFAAALGVLLAWLLLSVALTSLADMLLGAPDDPALLMHWRVLAFTAGLAALTALAAVLPPSVRVLRMDVNTTLKQGGGRDAKSGGQARSVLVVGQVMLSVGLLAVALLLVRSFWHTAVIDPGFDPGQSLVASVDLLRQGYSPEQAVQAQNAIIENLNAHPAVDSAAFARIVPVQSGGMRSTFQRPGIEFEERALTDINFITPGYFTTMRIPLQRGRVLSSNDRDGAPLAVVINRTLADRWFAGEDPIGQHMAFRRDELWQVVGIVADSKLRNVREENLPAAYFPLAQRPEAQANVIVRGHGEDPWTLLPVLREAIHSVDPALPLFRTRTLEQHVGRSYEEATVMAWLLSAFAALAVALSAAGLYGLLSWQVRTHTREIGIRLAIGATADAVRRQFLRRGMKLTVVGVALGLGVAVWAGQFLEALLYGLSVHDPVTLAAVSAGFLLIALLAIWAPAARSARINPMQALRDE